LDYDDGENPRELIIGEALGTMATELRRSRQRTAELAEDTACIEEKLRARPRVAREEFEEAVISIDAFPRCAMLLTIFEGMSVRAASVLLHADEALTRAAQRIGIVELTRNLTAPALQVG